MANAQPVANTGRRSRAKPKIIIVSRPKPVKAVTVVQAITVNPESVKAKSSQKRKQFKLVVHPKCFIWGDFPTPLDRKYTLPEAVSQWAATGHRWFKPPLVHQALCNTDGVFEPALSFAYNTWMKKEQINTLYVDIQDYVIDVSSDVFGIDPDRYVDTGPNQVIQFDNPSGYPLFIHKHPIITLNLTSEPATLSIHAITNTTPNQMKIVLNDAAYKLWGYTREQWESYERRQVPDTSDQEKTIPFFLALFAPSSFYTWVCLNLSAFYLHAKFAAFRCDIVRKDGKIVPMDCTVTTYLHSKFLHVSQLVFTDVGGPEPEPPLAIVDKEINDRRGELPELDVL